jgi:hypothetical protein
VATKTTFETEATRDAIRTLRDELTALLGEALNALPASGDASPEPQAPTSLREVARGWKRIHPSLRRLVEFTVNTYPGREFTWQDVARDMGEPLERVKSWHRSLSKQLNRTAREHSSAPPFMSSRWDGSRNHYQVSDEWREAIQSEW